MRKDCDVHINNLNGTPLLQAFTMDRGAGNVVLIIAGSSGISSQQLPGC